jgi:hypothetical protein
VSLEVLAFTERNWSDASAGRIAETTGTPERIGTLVDLIDAQSEVHASHIGEGPVHVRVMYTIVIAAHVVAFPMPEAGIGRIGSGCVVRDFDPVNITRDQRAHRFIER